MTGSRSGPWYRPSPLELATGLVLGTVPDGTPDVAGDASPREVLEGLLLEALRRPPCVVAFSGGRDSSAVLALAVHLARRHGLQPPIPATRRYPGDGAAEESDWQMLVIRHLAVREWIRLDVGEQCDLVGPLAAPLLRRHGLVWPPTLHVNVPLFEVARGGTLVTGEGGDEVFGPHRVTPVLHLLRGGRHRRAGAFRSLAGAIGPAAVRRRHWRRFVRATDHRTWLRHDARSAVIDALTNERVAEPLSWRAATVRIPRRRGLVLGIAARQRIADEYDVRIRHPLLAQRFLHALAASGHVLGPMTRAAAMRLLFGDILPPDVLRRTSKAGFNTTLLGGASRDFARDWRGGGVDTGLVDEGLLRDEWLRPLPHGGAFALLQAAWMAQRRWPFDGQA